MHGIHIKFDSLPTIGFAHHFHMERYSQSYNLNDDSIEIVYTKTGSIIAELYGETRQIEPQSVLVLSRRLPIKLYSADGFPHSHCSVQIKIHGEIQPILDDCESITTATNGIVVPFITPPCKENQSISKDLNSIISMVGSSGDSVRFSAALCAMGILSRLDRLYLQKLFSSRSAPSLLEYKIKRYIAENISADIPLRKIAEAIGKSPNYLNSIFQKANGMGIHQYINKEKVRIIGEFMKNRGFSFKEACESVSISDVSYGYRLFKKHMSVTPADFLKGAHLQK